MLTNTMHSGARWVHRKTCIFCNIPQNTRKHYAIWSILCSSENPDGDPGPPKARPCPPKGPICSRDWAWPSFGPSWPSFRTFSARTLGFWRRTLGFCQPKCLASFVNPNAPATWCGSCPPQSRNLLASVWTCICLYVHMLCVWKTQLSIDMRMSSHVHCPKWWQRHT